MRITKSSSLGIYRVCLVQKIIKKNNLRIIVMQSALKQPTHSFSGKTTSQRGTSCQASTMNYPLIPSLKNNDCLEFPNCPCKGALRSAPTKMPA
jgi:hypothetical protein